MRTIEEVVENIEDYTIGRPLKEQVHITIGELQKYLDEILEIHKAEQQKWIPVSERLPEENGCYLVTENTGRVCIYVFRKEGNSEEYWKRCAVAWMPLTEPYKAESEEAE